MKARLKNWIEQTRKESRKLLLEAEASRQKSDYTDIDALEQSTYNQAVLDTLEKLERIVER